MQHTHSGATPPQVTPMHTGRRVVRNTGINIAGALVPVLVALLTVPAVIHAYGVDRYGILAIALVVLSYFRVFDFGIGRATTKFLATALLNEGEGDVARLFWTSVSLNGLLGLVGGTLLAFLVPLLVRHTLHIPGWLTPEATMALYGVAVLVPIAITTASVFGALEAAHRFDLVNLLQTPASVLTQVLPLALVVVTRDVGVVVLGLVAVRLALLALAVTVCLRSIPELRRGPLFSRAEAVRLARFGGWLTVTNVVGPLMVNADRFLIGAVMTLASVTYYATPYDLVTKLLVFPEGLTRSLFPVFGAGTHEDRSSWRLMVMSSRYAGMLMGLVAVGLVALGPDLLRWWLGDVFAVHSGIVLQILAVGVMINAVAAVPYAWIQGVGYPDRTAKLHVCELLLYVPVLWLLLKWYGIAGAAIAWTARVTFDAVMLFVIAYRLTPEHAMWGTTRHLYRALGVLLAGLTGAVILPLLPFGTAVRFAVGACLLLATATTFWFGAVAADEKRFIADVLRSGLRRYSARGEVA